ncbi:MAG: shikimate dehydrogenase [Methanobrevibacter sp.]|jgi:shikimate dehydrogenase|nr:shikimate dehydrogenase [Candidatus Methanovirga australis]
MITGNGKIFGVIGDPVGHSLSTFMHNAVFKELNLDCVYVPFNVGKENLIDAINGAKSLNIKGLNVTIPHKINVMKFIDEISPIAKMIGAVNTIKFENGKTIGYNTDGIGAIKPLKKLSSLKNKKIIILGAGGAARAVGFQIAISGIDELLITNRNMNNAKFLINDLENKLNNLNTNNSNILKNSERLENLEKLNKSIDLNIVSDFNKDIIFNYGNYNTIKEDIKDCDILINATPVGLHPNVNESPIDGNILQSDLIVYDLIYNPIETKLLKDAKTINAKTISGVKMLVYQGAESLKIWTGVDAPIDTMERAVLSKL